VPPRIACIAARIPLILVLVRRSFSKPGLEARESVVAGRFVHVVRSVLVLLALWPLHAAAQQQPDIAIILAVDVSRSIDYDEFQLQRRGYAEAFQNPAVITAIRGTPHGSVAVAFMEWAGADFQRVVIPWTVISDAESGQLFAEQLLREPRSFYGWTSISGAIDYSMRMFEALPFQAQRRVIDVSGDGINNSGRPSAAARDEAVRRGIAINGLVIMNNAPNPGYGSAFQPALDEFYRENVIGGPGAFVVAVDDFESFAYAILNKLIREISSLPLDFCIAGLDQPTFRIAALDRPFAPLHPAVRAVRIH
jgi:hypothetical protein